MRNIPGTVYQEYRAWAGQRWVGLAGKAPRIRAFSLTSTQVASPPSPFLFNSRYLLGLIGRSKLQVVNWQLLPAFLCSTAVQCLWPDNLVGTRTTPVSYMYIPSWFHGRLMTSVNRERVAFWGVNLGFLIFKNQNRYGDWSLVTWYDSGKHYMKLRL